MDQFIPELMWLAWILPVLGVLLAYRYVFRVFGVLIIEEDSIGIVNKRFVLFGANRRLPAGRIIALNGEAGLQADTLAPGLHFGYWPWQYSVARQRFVTIEQGTVGIVESRDGAPLAAGRVLGRAVLCDSFQDARAFLANDGERGPQMAVIPPGTYRINTALFTLAAAKVLEIPDNQVGIVTTKEGKPLPAGDIAGPMIDGHNLFQDGQAFVDHGGCKGLQEQVMLAGRYFLNPRFATVELKEMTQVPIANVGVVVSFVGEPGKDVTGENFKHGNLVKKGEKGVWCEPLDPGKYPVNLYTCRVENVPTANVVLNWATGKSEAHKLDANLSTITVRSSDGFKFNLDVSQIIHIPRNEAPKVIARFGSMSNLVTQVLEPTIGNYFRNAAQGSDVIDFLKNRQQRQEEAREYIAKALAEYNVGAVDTLIGDIVPPDELMKTLTDRKIAEQEKVTYDTQKAAEEVRKELEQARAVATTQARVVDAERQVQIQGFSAEAAVKTAEGLAKSKTLVAEADAAVTRMTGDAEAGKTLAIGNAEAEVIKRKIESMDAGNYAAVQIANALSQSKQKLVPEITTGGAENGGIINALIGMMVGERLRNGQVEAK